MDNAAVVAQAVAAMRRAAELLQGAGDAETDAAVRLRAAADALAGEARDTERLDWRDSERLDWLEEWSTRPIAPSVVIASPHPAFSPLARVEFRNRNDADQPPYASTYGWRNAIDAARAAQEPTP